MIQVKLELVISEKKPPLDIISGDPQAGIWSNRYGFVANPTDPNPAVIPLDNNINRLHKISATLLPSGKWQVVITNTSGKKSKITGERDIIEIFTAFSEVLQFDFQNPTARTCPSCTCPTECDCQNYEAGLVSNHCPVHNEEPEPDPDCPQHNMILDIL